MESKGTKRRSENKNKIHAIFVRRGSIRGARARVLWRFVAVETKKGGDC